MSRLIESRDNLLWSKDKNYKKQQKSKQEDNNKQVFLYFSLDNSFTDYMQDFNFLNNNKYNKKCILTTTEYKKNLFLNYLSKSSPITVYGKNLKVTEHSNSFIFNINFNSFNFDVPVISCALNSIKLDMCHAFNVENFPMLTKKYNLKQNAIQENILKNSFEMNNNINCFFDNICKLIELKNSFDNILAKLIDYFNNLEKYDELFASLPKELRNIIREYI
jgi:hypothetical protein